VAFLGTRDRDLADTCSSADIARLTVLSRRRISQLRADARPDTVSAVPDAEGSRGRHCGARACRHRWTMATGLL